MDGTDRLTDAASRMASAGGSDLCLDLRFLTRAVLSLEMGFRPSGGPPWCDGERMVFDPGWVVDRFRNDSNGVARPIAHMALHCILGHFSPGNGDALDLAEDMVVEYVLDSLNTPHIASEGRDDRMYACEKFFAKAGAPVPELIAPLLEDLSEWRFDDYRRMFSVDDHSRRRGSPEGDWDEISKNAMTEVEAFSRSLDGRTEGLMRILRIKNRRRYDYRAFLTRFMTSSSTVKESLDEFDYIYYSYGLTVYGNMPLIDSLEYSDDPRVKEFVIAVDTSGSTMRGPVVRFLEEAFEVMRRCNPSGDAELHVIQCDDTVRSDDVVRSEWDMRLLMDGFQLKGGGRTDFRPVFDYVDGLVGSGELKGLKGLIYFTDGMGTYPTRRPGYDTAFVFCDSGYTEHEVPPWAIKIIVPVSDLEP